MSLCNGWALFLAGFTVVCVSRKLPYDSSLGIYGGRNFGLLIKQAGQGSRVAWGRVKGMKGLRGRAIHLQKGLSMAVLSRLFILWTCGKALEEG